MMEERYTVGDLHDILANEAEDYRLLVDLTRLELAALLKSSIGDLKAAVKDKESLMIRLSRLAQKRDAIIVYLVKELNLSSKITLTELMSHFEDTAAKKLMALRQEFIRLMEQLLFLNHRNSLLLQSELTTVEATFDYITTTAAASDAAYTADGRNQALLPQSGGYLFNYEV